MSNEGAKRILVVDDDQRLQFLAGRVLEAAGYTVDFADDGGAAIEKISRGLPDLMILDLNLPVVDGRAVLEHLRGLPASPPVVVLTAHGQDFPGANEVREQAAALMSKPFSLHELVATCEKILRVRTH